MVAAIRGYGYIAITNAKCSQEKRDSMAAYGGQLIVAKDGLAADHPEHYVNLEAGEGGGRGTDRPFTHTHHHTRFKPFAAVVFTRLSFVSTCHAYT